MSAEILPYPLAGRRGLIMRQAIYAGSLSPEDAEQHIARQLTVQAQTMRRKGIAEHRVIAELESMEAAIRRLLLSAVSGGAR